MLVPPPVVVDSDVLLRNVDHAVSRGFVGALTRHASTGYSMMSAVVLFASSEAEDEVGRHLVDVAKRRHVSLEAVEQVWRESFAPAVRFVEAPDWLVDDPRIEGTHPKDRHVARLACLLAPAVLVTDNRKHFKPFDLPDTKTDAVAKDLAAVGRFVTGARGAAVIPTATGALTIEGSKKVIAKLGRTDALLIGLLLIGALALFLGSDRGQALRAKVGSLAEEFGPQLAELVEQANAAGDRVRAFAIDGPSIQDPVGLLARCLATEHAVMTTAEVADWLSHQRLGFRGERSHRTETRAWLSRTPCFEEVARGRWALGRHAGDR